MSSIVIGGNSALWMKHQFAACGNSCNPNPKQPSIELTQCLVQSVRWGNIITDDYFWNQMLSVSNSQWNCLPLHFLWASQLSKKYNVVDVWEEKTVILARKLGRRNDHTSRCSLVRWNLLLFLHGMNATFSAWALSNDEGSFRWVIAASLLVRKMQNPDRNSSF